MKHDQGLRLLMMGLAAAVALISVSAAEQAFAETQRFVPNPAEAYADFVPLPEPSANVSVGALWIQGYGPHGEGAAADNLQTVRGVNGLTISRNLQLSLTMGLLNFLNIDPGLRNQISARFSDLSIVRVKDLSKLAGPSGEPRIYEALRAGSVTISTDSNLSLNLGGSLIEADVPVTGRGSGARVRSYTLDARDMFIAIRVVTPTAVVMHRRELDLSKTGSSSARLEGYLVKVDGSDFQRCLASSQAGADVDQCTRSAPIAVELGRPSSGDSTQFARARLSIDTSSGSGRGTLPLPVPLSDGRGGLLETLEIELAISIQEKPVGSIPRFTLRRASTAAIWLSGHRLQPLDRLQSGGP